MKTDRLDIIPKNLHPALKISIEKLNIQTAACQPAEVHIVVLDLFTLNHQEILKETITFIRTLYQLSGFHTHNKEGGREGLPLLPLGSCRGLL